MARTTAAPPAPPAPPSREPERLTLKLSRPIKADDGRTWSEITIVEPELSHHIEADRKASGMERAIAIYATISGIPEDAIRPLAAAYLKGEPVESEITIITRQQAEEADYSLSPSRWVGQSSTTEVGSVIALVRELSELDRDAHRLSATISRLLTGVVDEPA